MPIIHTSSLKQRLDDEFTNVKSWLLETGLGYNDTAIATG